MSRLNCLTALMLALAIFYLAVELVNLALIDSQQPILVTITIFATSSEGREAMRQSDSTWTSKVPKVLYILLGTIVWIDCLVVGCASLYARQNVRVDLAMFLHRVARFALIAFAFEFAVQVPVETCYFYFLEAYGSDFDTTFDELSLSLITFGTLVVLQNCLLFFAFVIFF